MISIGLTATWLLAEIFHHVFDYVCHANSLDQDMRCLLRFTPKGAHTPALDCLGQEMRNASVLPKVSLCICLTYQGKMFLTDTCNYLLLLGGDPD